MKISSGTLSILKNCATIDSSIMFKPGNRISTVSFGGDILLRADVEENFPMRVGIHDLNQLLATLSLIGDQDITFNEKSLLISSGEHNIEYFYSGEGIVQWDEKWDKPVKDLKSHFEFVLTDKDISLIQKAASIFSSPTLTIKSDTGDAVLIVSDPEVLSSNSYKKILGETSAEFNYKLAMTTLKVMPDSYTVVLPVGKKRIYLKGTTYKTQYWLAAHPESEA